MATNNEKRRTQIASDVNKFVNTLRGMRYRLDASPEQMARHMKMTPTQYKRIETGANTPNLVDRKQIIKRAEGLLKRCGLK